MKRLITGLIAASLTASAWAAEHKIAFHVDQNDPQVMNMTLNNVQNAVNYYKAQGDTATIEVVAYGPCLNMFIAGKSPVADRIERMSLDIDNLAFKACGNTHKNMSKKAGKDVKLLDATEITPSGVIRLIELQKKAYAYIRP
jgi:intracellular sulfur oxidation DsrE/DsrF family protein